MANKLRDEDLTLNIIVNGDKGKKELGDLEKSTRELTNRNKELRLEKEKLTRAGKQETDEYKAIEKQLRENNKAIKTNETRMTELRKEIGLTGLTMRQLRSEQVRLKRLMDSSTPGTEQWKKYNAELLRVESQIEKVSTGAKASQFSMGKMADGFNRYFSMVTVWVASLTGIVLGFKKAASAYAEFTDQVADIQKTTNLSKDKIIELDKELQKIDTRTSQEQLLGLARIAGKLGKNSAEDVLGFVRAADQISVSLNEDLGGDIEETVRQLGKLTNIFNLEQQFGTEQALLKVGSVINELGAASTANEGYLVEFAGRMAGIAPAAKITIDEVLGLAATLDQLGQTSEVSGTVFAQIIPNMFKDTKTYANIARMSVDDFQKLLDTDANEAIIRFLEGLNGNNGGLSEMATKLDGLGLDGARAVNVLTRLAQSTQLIREQQALANIEFEKGTSLTNEFNIKNNTVQAGLEKSRKNLSLTTRELGESLSPAVLFSTNGITYFIKAMVALIRFTKEYYPIIISSIAGITAYTVATKLATMWQNGFRIATIASTVSQKLQTLAFNAQFAAIALYNSVVALMAGKIKVAAIQFRAFSAALMANPIGIAVGAVVALGTGLYFLSKRLSEAEKLQRTLNEVNLEAAKNIVEQKTNVELLMAAAKNENRTLAERKKALEELNKISPEYFENLTLEKINSQEATEATKAYTEALLEQARVQAAKEKLVELEKERIDAIQSGSDYQSKWYQTAWNGVKSFGNAATFAYNQAITGAKNATAADAEYLKQKVALIGIIGQQKKSNPVIPGEEGNDGGTNTTPDDETPDEKAYKKALVPLESAGTKAQTNIKQQLLEKLITEEQANEALLAAEIEFLEKKKALQIKYGQDYQDTEAAIIDKKLQAAKDADKKSEDEKKKAHDKILKDLDNKEAEELNGIKKQLADKQITEEEAQQDILTKEIEFLNQRIALKIQWGEDTAELEGKVLDKTNQIAENALKTDEARAKQLYDLRKDFEDEEVARAQEKAAALAELDTLYKAGMLSSEEEYQRLKTKIVEKYEGSRFEKTQAYLGAVNNILGGAADFFANLKDAELAKAGDNAAKREKIEKEYAKKQKAIAIGQAIIAGAMAVMQLWAEKSVIPFPASAILKGVMTGVIAGTTIAQIAKIKNAEFYDGGHTGPGGKYEPRGIVHAEEYVIPQEGTQNPMLKPVIDIIEIARRNGSLARLDLRQIVQAIPAKGFSSGGFTSDINTSRLSSFGAGVSGGIMDQEQNKILKDLAAEIKELRKWKPTVYTELIKKDLETLNNIQQKRGL